MFAQFTDFLLEQSRKRSWRELTPNEMRGLLDTIKQIDHLAKLKNKLLGNKDARDFADKLQNTLSEMYANAKICGANPSDPKVLPKINN